MGTGHFADFGRYLRQNIMQIGAFSRAFCREKLCNMHEKARLFHTKSTAKCCILLNYEEKTES